ncbi:3'-5' exonuclease [Brucepastera parasyntrophica]|uniref:3'-5' exonuclease n=1 Tax=Brucepastera parasyntrophica TaxID=2880008 RepID=UPI00210CCAF0|nr:3'-5' exonuclease [Brucepastera parasyntrophica]ULQ60195.1 3'-5' exonuclease [Brucepastera parasyntrophica]
MGKHDWLLAIPGEAVFTAFDTETTGLDPKQNRVIEIGAIRFDAGGIISRFNVLINPGIPIEADISAINGITNEMVAKQPAIHQVLPDFLQFIGSSILIAHNAPFDISFINEELSRMDSPVLNNSCVDTRIFAKEVFPGQPKYALQDLAVSFGIKAKQAHRAEDDARVCMELFLHCFSKLRGEKHAGA